MKRITRRQFLQTAAAAGVLGTVATAGALPAGACIDPPPAAGYPQQVTIGAYDFGPCVSSTQFKLRQTVRAGNVRAEDFLSAYETKDCYDWEQIYAGEATVSGVLPVADAYPCDKNGTRTERARMLRLDFSPVRQDANVVGGVFHFDPAQHTTRWCNDYSLSIGLTGNASVSGRLFGLPVTQVEVDPAVDLAQAHIPALEPFRLDGHFTGSDGRTAERNTAPTSGSRCWQKRSRRWRETPSRKRWAARPLCWCPRPPKHGARRRHLYYRNSLSSSLPGIRAWTPGASSLAAAVQAVP